MDDLGEQVKKQPYADDRACAWNSIATAIGQRYADEDNPQQVEKHGQPEATVCGITDLSSAVRFD